jgi:hypothetical protein
MQRKYYNLAKSLRSRFSQKTSDYKEIESLVLKELKRIASRENNKILAEFPAGFHSFKDLYQTADLIKSVLAGGF